MLQHAGAIVHRHPDFHAHRFAEFAQLSLHYDRFTGLGHLCFFDYVIFVLFGNANGDCSLHARNAMATEPLIFDFFGSVERIIDGSVVRPAEDVSWFTVNWNVGR
jgi:hypothetical protein